MSQDRCQEIKDQLHALRAGEVSPLQRTKLESHLDSCARCSAELWLQSELEDAAKIGPTPLTERRKRNILGDIHQEIGLASTPARTPATNWWLRILVPGLSAAMATAAVLLLVTLRETPPAVEQAQAPTTATGWIQADLGVQAFAVQPALVEFKQHGMKPLLHLQRGAVLIEYSRQPNSEPLEVHTPHAVVVVRGTVFSVDAQQDHTLVTVQRGQVEVIAHNGQTTLVSAGEQARATSADLVHGKANPEMLQWMLQLYPGPALQDEEIMTTAGQEDSLQDNIDADADIQAPGAKAAAPLGKKRRRPAATIDSEALSRYVRQNMQSVQRCYEKELKKDTHLSGSLDVEVTIDVEGKIEETGIAGDTLESAAVQECVLQHIHRWQPPAAQGGSITVTIPFVFAPTE